MTRGRETDKDVTTDPLQTKDTENCTLSAHCCLLTHHEPLGGATFGGDGVERHAFRATVWLFSPALAGVLVGVAPVPSLGGEGVAAAAGEAVVIGDGVGMLSVL